MRGLTITLAGLRHRRARSAMIFLIAACAATAVVGGTAYSRAAEQSLLAERLAAAPEDIRGLGFTATQRTFYGVIPSAPLSSSVLVSDATKTFDHPAFGPGVGGASVSVKLPYAETFGFVAQRDNVCAHLRMVTGRCVTAKGEVVVAASTQERIKIPVGTKVVATDGSVEKKSQTLTVVGIYEPANPGEAYWHARPYFFEGPETPKGVPPSQAGTVLRLSSWFATPDTVAVYDKFETETYADFTLRPDRVDLDNVRPLVADIRQDGAALSASFAGGGVVVSVNSGLAGILRDVDRNRDLIALSAPLAIGQLLLLCWFVLYLVVAHATDDLGPEVGLAKLRGLGRGGTALSGLGESLLLVLLAVPVGFAVGLGAVELVAVNALAEGVHAEVRAPVFLICGLAVVGGLGAALLASRKTLARPVSDLLRRVPPRRSRWGASVLEAMVGTVAAIGLLQLFTERGNSGRSPLVLAVPALLAIVVGIVATKALPLLAGRWTSRSGARGRTSNMLAFAQLARRPATTRAVVIGTVAIALLVFGAQAWDTASRNRNLRAGWEVGANRVLTVEGTNPAGLIAAVRKADPGGKHAMAAARTGDPGQRSIIAVDTTRLAAVALWDTAVTDAPVRQVADRLRPAAQPVATLKSDALAVDVTVTRVTGDAPFRLIAYVEPVAGGQRTEIVLGALTPGAHTFRAPILCTTGCRFVGLKADLPSSAPPGYEIDYRISAIRDAQGKPLPLGLTDGDAWRTPDPDQHDEVSHFVPGPDGLGVKFRSGGHDDARILHADAPWPLPALVTDKLRAPSAGAPTLLTDGAFTADQRYRPVDEVAVVPRGGENALLVDLNYADLIGRGEAGFQDNRLEVWLAPGAPESIVTRLAADGIRVIDTDTVAQRRELYEQEGPTLALGLYLAAAMAAALLAVGAVGVNAYISLRHRRIELSSLRLAGLSGRRLRRSLVTEYVAVLGVLVAGGVLAGALAIWWALPDVPIFTAPIDAGLVQYRVAPVWAVGLLAVTLALLAGATTLIIRGLLRNDGGSGDFVEVAR